MSGAVPERRAGPAGRALAPLLLAPSLLQVVGRGPVEGALVAAGVAATVAVFALGRASRAERASRALLLALCACFFAPTLPTVLGAFGFAYERVFIGAALACLAWSGALAPRPSASSLPRLFRALLVAWGAWSAGSAARALWLALPPDAPWLGDALVATFTDLLGYRSLVEPTHALPRLSLRLEELCLAWAALEVSLADPRFPARLARGFALVLPLGVLVNVAAVAAGAAPERPFAVLWDANLDRLHHPLPDHNALAAALALMLPPAAVAALRGPAARGDGLVRALALAGPPVGLVLLVLTSSKSGLAGLALGAVAGALLWIALAARRLRRPAAWAVGAGLLAVLGVQLLPRAVADELMQRRYLRDVVKAARLDFARSYLADMRYPVWRGAVRMWEDAPLVGQGLGRFPRLLARFRDPRGAGWFDPLHENAHDQYLQWLAEEGLVGAALGTGILLLALGASVRAARQPAPAEGEDESGARLAACAAAASFAGLAVGLAVGHPLLVPAVAGLAAGLAGATVARAARSTAAAPAAAGGLAATRALPALALLAPLAAAPAALEPRAALSEHELGCYPWLLTRTEAGVDLSRMLAPDARWMQRWGDGSRMFLVAKSVVVPGSPDGPQRVDAWVAGAHVVRGVELPVKGTAERFNPTVVLKLDAPPGVRAGDLVEVRIACRPPTSESRMSGLSQAIVGPRVWVPTFGDPR